MTIIQNGHRWPLQIEGVFDGECGVGDGRIAFRPLAPGLVSKANYSALLNGRSVVLSDVRPAGDGRSYTAKVLG